MAATRRSYAKRRQDAAIYDGVHKSERRAWQPRVASGKVDCARCGFPILPGQPWDLGHVDGSMRRYQGPEHRACNRRTAKPAQYWVTPPSKDEPPPEPDGIPAKDERWAVEWLEGLRRPPRNATWPRLMTVPHPRAVGSLGAEFIAWAEKRTGRRLRWWQRLVAIRLLEVDEKGELCWETMILTVARQLGKSWLLRELCLWRIHQGARFGEPQDVMHTGKDVAICKEVQRPARIWAKAQRDLFKVREVNGQEEIELLADGSRWMLRAKGAVYGYGASASAVDEGWKVSAAAIEEGLVPTMVERIQPQLWLISTAHRLSTGLMLGRRHIALADLESGDGDLLVEWSAPPAAELDDVKGWRSASPHWTPKREKMIRKRMQAALAGETDDPEEPDPVEAFRAQWLNQWPRRKVEIASDAEELLPAGQWEALAEAGLASDGPIFVAIEDDYGRGAAVSAAARLEDGRIEVDGWLCHDWDTAVADVQRLGGDRRIRQFLVGASMLSRMPPGLALTPRPAGGRETRAGLPLLRDLAASRTVAHDAGTAELDQAVTTAQVRESRAGGLYQVHGINGHLLRAAVWAISAAHRPARMPAVR